MIRKVLLLAMAAGISLVIPTLASGAQVTESTGNAYPLGTSIASVSENTIVLTEGLGIITCDSMAVELELVENGAQIAAEGIGEGTTTACAIGDNDLETTDLTWGHFETTGYHEVGGSIVGTGSVDIGFTTDLPGVSCEFSGTPDFSYLVGTNELHIEGVLNGGACGEVFIEGDCALSASLGVILD